MSSRPGLLVFLFLVCVSASPLAQSPARRPAVPPRPAVHQVGITVERPAEGAPLTFGVPFPKGALDSPDHVRVVTRDGREVPAQVTQVATWYPADASIKWAWVFFFAQRDDRYVLEFGRGVRRAPIAGPTIQSVNNQRPAGSADISTGALRFVVKKSDGGFLSRVELGGAIGANDDRALIGSERESRGSFLDLVNDRGVDRSKAFVHRTMLERGSGPLHAILRVDGEYRYAQPDHKPAPFVTRIHAYAGRTYLRIEHTFIYTGEPDRHVKREGEHEHIATQTEHILDEVAGEPGWTEPNDRIEAAGLQVDLALGPNRRTRTALRDGAWWQNGALRSVAPAAEGRAVSVLQTGPKPNRIPPVPESTSTERLRGFEATVASGDRVEARAERAVGLLDVTDGTRGVTVAMPRVLEEYPKELRVEATGRADAFFWSPRVEPMSFARWSADLDREEETISVENNAQGIAKTSEAVFDFHDAGVPAAEVDRRVGYFLEAPVAHVDPSWYGRSGAFGRFAPRSDAFPGFERALDYKFEWMLFNQRWAPWFGMWDYGDWKLYYDGARWTMWGNNEPSEDFICWIQFMRTGDPRLFDAAQASSRHSMDVDNLHWPADPVYIGDTNSSLDYLKFREEPKGSKYVGIGSRHAVQHWVRTLGAHVWVQGWLASYFLAADHRGLDVAIETAEFHLRRIWGEHGLTGRRLYLAMWNLVEAWDATKDDRYRKEIDDLVQRMLWLQQREQGGSLSVERYGYADVYVTHGLAKYLDLTGDTRVRAALLEHARRLRDNPPRNHLLESYLSSVNALTLGYRLSGERSFLDEARARVAALEADPIARPFSDPAWTQASLFDAVEKTSHLPGDPARPKGKAIWSATNGLRVFGWTHEYILPFLMDALGRADARR